MKNTMISKEELEALQEVFKSVDHLVKVHENSTSEIKGAVDRSTKVEKLHIIMYLDMSKDLIKAVQLLRAIIEVSEEDFIRAVTKEGKMSLEEALNFCMFKSLIKSPDKDK